MTVERFFVFRERDRRPTWAQFTKWTVGTKETPALFFFDTLAEAQKKANELNGGKP